MERKESLDEILESFDNSKHEKRSREGGTLTFWVPLETKKKFDEIQRTTNRGFSPVLKEILEMAIDG